MNRESTDRVINPLRLAASCLLLLSGLVVYWLFRPDIVLFQLLHIDNPNPLPADGPLARLLSHYFADAAWCLALVLVVGVLRDYRVPRIYRQALVVLPFLSEFMQLAGLIPGVFDLVDLAVYLLIIFPTLVEEFRPMKKIERNLAGSIAIAFFTLAVVASTNTAPKPQPAPAPAPAPPPEPKNIYVIGTFFLKDRANDIFTKSDLINSLKISGSPSIVLRVPNPGDKVTSEQKQKNSVLYNAIEKEFAKAGFVVRDRQLFAKVLEQETSDYSKIGLITETDFILELLSYDLKVKTEARSYIDENGDSAESPIPVWFNSAVAEFKLISVKKNALAGTYTFYYTPCIEGCKERFDLKAREWKVNNAVPTDFFENVALELVKELGYLR